MYIHIYVHIHIYIYIYTWMYTFLIICIPEKTSYNLMCICDQPSNDKILKFLSYFILFFQSYAAGRQTKRIREKYFEALLRKEVSYFDVNNQGAISVSVMDATLVIQEALGKWENRMLGVSTLG
jgi:ABC-type multidrug transport system fused ATPase/permease subunit